MGISAFSFLSGLKVGEQGWERLSDLVQLTRGHAAILSRNPMQSQGLRRYRGLWNLHGQCGWKSFLTRSLRADQNLWNFQPPVSVAGAIFGQKPRCAARSRDVADGNAAGSWSAFRTFPFAVDKHRGSNPGSWSAIADRTPASAGGDTPADHRSPVVV